MQPIASYGEANVTYFRVKGSIIPLATGTAGLDSTTRISSVLFTLEDYFLIQTWSGEKLEPSWEGPYQALLLKLLREGMNPLYLNKMSSQGRTILNKSEVMHV
jgi:hypothetical protein